MFAELFEIASEFFAVSIIPAVIGFVILLVSVIRCKKFPIIVSILLSMLGAILIFAIMCVIIYLITLYIAAILLVSIIGGIIIALILAYINGDL